MSMDKRIKLDVCLHMIKEKYTEYIKKAKNQRLKKTNDSAKVGYIF